MDVSEPATAVMSRGEAAVLRALAGADVAFTIRQLARVAGVSRNRAHQVIRKLSAHGLVHTENQGPSKLCRLNRDHLAADAVAVLVQLRARLVEFVRFEIAQWPCAPSHASLFGSAARGDGHTSSDLDVLVVRSNEQADSDLVWEQQLAASGQRIHDATGNRVAWFNVTVADVTRAVAAEEPIIDEWRRDAVHLSGVDLRALLRAEG